MPEPWNDDPPGSQSIISSNLAALWPSIAADAAARTVPTVSMAQEWHRAVFRGVRIPITYYAGEIRDRDPRFPELYGYEVVVGDTLAVLSANVPPELARFERRVQEVCQRLDAAIPAGEQPATEVELRAAIALSANVHGEWIRIHPFANGNGRTARVWGNWIAVRYGLPPFVRIRPRPEGALSGMAAAASMRGDHSLTTVLFGDLLNEALGLG